VRSMRPALALGETGILPFIVAVLITAVCLGLAARSPASGNRGIVPWICSLIIGFIGLWGAGGCIYDLIRQWPVDSVWLVFAICFLFLIAFSGLRAYQLWKLRS
jgi:hypothetical protein